VTGSRAKVRNRQARATALVEVLHRTYPDAHCELDFTNPLELLVFGGSPAEGPLVFHGPFVMNSVEQVRAAEVAYRTGRMGSLEDSRGQ